ncbi:MAG: extracellular solute-binding protein [Bryobacterales bacterium]|nr:extracellular solute-binding protein [Bryobacterales bacterium]
MTVPENSSPPEPYRNVPEHRNPPSPECRDRIVHLTSRRHLLLASLGTACAQRRKGAVLTVFTWAGPWGQTFERFLKPLFEKATGATVLFDNGWGEEIPKLLVAPPDQPPYDVMIVAPFQVYPLIRQGHFARLDFGKIPNLRGFSPEALDNWVAREQWGLTWPDAMHTGVYRTDLRPFVPERWEDFLAMSPGLYRASYMSLYTFAAMGWPGRAAEAIEQDFESVFQYARERRRKIRQWWPTSPGMAFHLLQGNVSCGNIHSVDVFPMFAARRPIDVLLTPDRAHFQAIWLVPKGTRYNALAHEFLNQFASVQFQRAYAAAGFPTPVAEAAPGDPLWKRLYSARARYYPYDAYVKHWNSMTERWNKEVLV